MVNQYNHYIKYNRSIIIYLFEELHSLYSKRNILFNIIKNHKSYLIMIGFPYNKLEDIQNNLSCKSINVYYDFDDDVKHMTLRANLSHYVYITCTKIPEVLEKINYYRFMSSIPFKTFKDICFTLNKEISNKLLLGDSYEIPGGGGLLKIKRYTRKFKKKVVDWGESNKLKQTNPDKYIVFHVDDEFTAVHYDKSLAKFPNYKFYRFKLTSFINTKDRSKLNYYNSVNTNEEILNSDNVGNYQKMMAMIKLNTIKHYDKHDI